MKTNCSSIEPLEARIAPATIIVNTIADTTGVSGQTSLRDALALADDPSHPGVDTIIFKLPRRLCMVNIIKLGGTELRSGGNVKIVGPGAGKLIIDDDGQSRIFDFNDNASSADSPVSISGLSIMHGHATGGVGIGSFAQKDYGGGIYSAESLTLKNVVISGNSADKDAGGLSVAGNSTDTKLSISNCLVTDNTSGNDGGGVEGFLLKSLTISKTTVTGNTAPSKRGGGIYAGVYTSGTGITITSCVISGNTASYGGGLLVNNLSTTAKTTISGTKITGNISTNTSGKYGGGGVYVEKGNTVITGCTISNNTAVYNGGGIFSSKYCSSLTISKCTISSNQTTATNVGSYGGGGVFIEGKANATPEPVTITNSQINDNGSAKEGGGVFAKNGIALNVSNTTFSGNHAAGIGGGIATRGNDDTFNNIFNKVNLTVTGGTFSGNTANAGGGISAEGDGAATTGDGAFSMVGSKVTGNTAQAVGGGIEITTNGAVTVKNAVVAGNVGVNYGGGLSISVSKSVVVSGGSVSGNFSHRGGGMWVYQTEGSISGVTISGNAAKNDGGGVNAGNSNVTLQVAKVTGNTAASNPNFGGITSVGAAAKTPKAGKGTFVVTTTADEMDGGTLLDPKGPDGVLSLREALALADLTPDTVDTIGFALPAQEFIDGGGAWIIKLTGTQLGSLGNVKIVGPGAGKLILDGDDKSRVLNINDGDSSGVGALDSPCTISGLSVIRGNVTNSGGGVRSYESLTLSKVVISGNSSGNAGGGVEVFAPKATISNSFFTGNHADGGGGGVFLQTQSSTIKKSVVTGNTVLASGHSGGIYAGVSNPTDGSIAISDSLIAGNSAGYAGGLYLDDDNQPAFHITVNNTKITGNTAIATSGRQGGGGVYMDFASHTSLIGCTISNNEASGGGGGGIEVSNSDALLISKSTISGNRTTAGSGASGGGLFLGDGANPLESVSITKSVIADNISDGNGGGVHAFGGVALHISKSTVVGNHASDKGGGVSSVDSLTVSGSTFADNTAKYGGGIKATGAVTISTSKISGNIASKGGGGVYANGVTGTLSLLKNTFAGNFASTGGGLFINTTPDFVISGGSFIGNFALEGGAIEVGASAGSIDALITGNAANRGGGIFNQSATADAITLHIAKIIANTAFANPNVGDNPGTLGTFTFV